MATHLESNYARTRPATSTRYRAIPCLVVLFLIPWVPPAAADADIWPIICPGTRMDENEPAGIGPRDSDGSIRFYFPLITICQTPEGGPSQPTLWMRTDMRFKYVTEHPTRIDNLGEFPGSEIEEPPNKWTLGFIDAFCGLPATDRLSGYLAALCAPNVPAEDDYWGWSHGEMEGGSCGELCHGEGDLYVEATTTIRLDPGQGYSFFYPVGRCYPKEEVDLYVARCDFTTVFHFTGWPAQKPGQQTTQETAEEVKKAVCPGDGVTPPECPPNPDIQYIL